MKDVMILDHITIFITMRGLGGAAHTHSTIIAHKVVLKYVGIHRIIQHNSITESSSRSFQKECIVLHFATYFQKKNSAILLIYAVSKTHGIYPITLSYFRSFWIFC